ncbi:MBL fold metallo-hydrolase [uncultured Thomasclavelia sp.]|uniref:MBL fold metallo-hydrolase n=1 Tax=uncultured Thomasclavelia sp. TaxID=3025759 RepID=UPI0025DB5514|nr:MBL fold metallo-hydrolase [uncultured Thomasclavelia sp.]
MEFHVLASGSKGNSTFIYDHGVGLLIDCGITRKQLIYKLKTLGFDQNNINYVLLTHDHYDHNKNIGIFDKRICFCGQGCIKEIAPDHVLIPYQEVEIGDYHILPLSISHDATSPLAFVIKGKSEAILYMTDTGYVSQKNRQYIHNLDYYIIESNHDIEMLMATKRPYFLKQRIQSDTGHLDNRYSANMMAEMVGDKTKEIVLAHLSEEANTKEKALETYLQIFKENGVDFANIKVASQIDIVSGGKRED